MTDDTAEWRDMFKVKLHLSLDILCYSLLRHTFSVSVLNHTQLKTSFVREIMGNCIEQHVKSAFVTHFPFYTFRLFYKRPTLPKTCVSRTQP